MTVQPASIGELQESVRAHERIVLVGGGTKSDHASEGTTPISTGRVSGITEYSPEECVFTALAGTSISAIQRTLDARGQYLPFDPPFADLGATIGGTVATGASGPGRYRYGGVRDFLIGVRIVDGEGRIIRSGGKVVKNAAGFLLHHGIVGSLGLFGAVAEVTFKVFPRPEAREHLVIDCGSVEAAFSMARTVEGLRQDCEAIDFDLAGKLSIRIAGRASGLAARVQLLSRRLSAAPHSAGTAGAASQGPGMVPAPVHEAASHRASCVKVAGLMNSWQTLRPHVAAAQFMCAGATAWLATEDLPALTRALGNARLTGLVIRGPGAGRRVGYVPFNPFEERVRRVLDPQNRFRAASDPD